MYNNIIYKLAYTCKIKKQELRNVEKIDESAKNVIWR